MSNAISKVALVVSILSGVVAVVTAVSLNQLNNYTDILPQEIWNLRNTSFNYFDQNGVSVLVPWGWAETGVPGASVTFTSPNDPNEKEVINFHTFLSGFISVQKLVPSPIKYFHESPNGLSEWFASTQNTPQPYPFVGIAKIDPPFGRGASVEVFAPTNNESRTSQIINSFRLVQ